MPGVSTFNTVRFCTTMKIQVLSIAREIFVSCIGVGPTGGLEFVQILYILVGNVIQSNQNLLRDEK